MFPMCEQARAQRHHCHNLHVRGNRHHLNAWQCLATLPRTNNLMTLPRTACKGGLEILTHKSAADTISVATAFCDLRVAFNCMRCESSVASVHV